MSKADELFKSLGYKKNFEDKYRANYENTGYETIINFDKDIKEIRIWNNGINTEELQAINEKVKELRLEIETSLKSDKKERENKMDKKYPPIVGKCKERLDNGTCLGCNRLELYDFTGDDNCPLFRDEEPKQVEINEKGEKNEL